MLLSNQANCFAPSRRATIQVGPCSRCLIAAVTMAWASTASAQDTASLNFVAVTPCRVVDTRYFSGALGGPDLAGGMTRSFPIPAGSCGIPPNASAYSFNVTVVPVHALGYLSIWPTGHAQPVVSTLNSPDGRIVANAAVVPAGDGGAISVFVTDETHVILDVNGYFTNLGVNANLAFNRNPGDPASPIFPHPFESDQGWGGGARPQQIIDGYRGCDDPSGWACGLAFTGGNANWGGQACGVRQATVDLGSRPAQVSSVRITHHGDEHVPMIYQIQTWNGSTWNTVVSTTTNSQGRCTRVPTITPPGDNV